MNAQLPLSNKTLSYELWIAAAICWFGKRYLPESKLFQSADFDQKLADQMNFPINNFNQEFLKISIGSLDIPANSARALNGLPLTNHDLFLLFLCSEIENNYWLNLAIQELQGPHENTYPKVHLICELMWGLFSVKINSVDISQHLFVKKYLLKLEKNGPMALAWLEVNKDIWLPLIEGDQSQVKSLVVENKSIPLIGFVDHHKFNSIQNNPIGAFDSRVISIQSLKNIDRHKPALDSLSLELRLKPASQVYLYAPLPQAMAFGCELAFRLDLVPVVVDPELYAQPEKFFWLSRAFDWLPVIFQDESLAISDFQVRSIIISVYKKSAPLSAASSNQTNVIEYKIPLEGYAERFFAWSDWVDSELAEILAKRWLINSSAIPAIMKQANLMVGENREKSLENKIIQARLDLAPESLGDMAINLPQKIHHQAVVFPKLIDDDLNRLLQRCRNRDDIFTHLGHSAAANQNKGVRALFSGESGTGKTLAASYIASQLGAPLYRMDLGSILNKYIGETEKNIARVMDQACEQDFIILIDEADALFGKRTDVESSGERFANMLTNYLLSRIEQYAGIVLMTTNGMGRIDSAFMRRLDMIIEFNAPEVAERTRIWQSHLGNRSPGDDYCRQLASLCDLTGGYIRNAVLAAAADLPYTNSPTLPYALLLRNLANEYRKSGKPVPPKLAAQITASAN